MENENTIKNYGIIASISWNSKNWSDHATQKDLNASNYEYVKENGRMHESLNFGHELYPPEEGGFYIGYTPMFNRAPAFINSKNVQIVFFISSDYKNSNQKSIVGFYGYPIFGQWFKRETKHSIYKDYDSGNIIAFPKDIIYFKNPIIINNESAQINNLLPEGKKISQQGFNYLNSDNVYNLIKSALSLNPENTKLKSFVEKFSTEEKLTKEKFELLDCIDVVRDLSSDTLKDIEKLERKMKSLKPEVKQRISNYIERGIISNKVKKLNNYKCSVCEVMGSNTNSFIKTNGETYIETHHVEPVSTIKEGILGTCNLMTVCANHHRQLHYGDVELIENTKTEFLFRIENHMIKIEKIKIQ